MIPLDKKIIDFGYHKLCPVLEVDDLKETLKELKDYLRSKNMGGAIVAVNDLFGTLADNTHSQDSVKVTPDQATGRDGKAGEVGLSEGGRNLGENPSPGNIPIERIEEIIQDFAIDKAKQKGLGYGAWYSSETISAFEIERELKQKLREEVGQ